SRRPGWWWAVALTCLGAGLHVVALRFGPLTVVQPLGALTLVFAVPLSAALLGRRPPGVEQRGVLVTVAGLAGLLLLTGSSAPTGPLDTGEVLGVGAATVAVVALLLACAGIFTGPIKRGLGYAAASGIVSGVASALAQTVTVLVGERGWPGLL